jgi:hypothetical protein
MRSRETIIAKICKELQPSGKDAAALAAQIRGRLDLLTVTSSRLTSIGNAAAISKAAKEFRIEFHESKLGGLLKETGVPAIFKSPGEDKADDQGRGGIGAFEVIDLQLESLTHVTGPAPQSDISKHLTGLWARILIDNFSERSSRHRETSLRIIVPLIHELRTGEQDKPLKRICDAAIERSGW